MLIYVRPTNEALLSARVPIMFYVSSEERTRLPSTARIERAHSDRVRSASKEGTWPLLILNPLIAESPRVTIFHFGIA